MRIGIFVTAFIVCANLDFGSVMIVVVIEVVVVVVVVVVIATLSMAIMVAFSLGCRCRSVGVQRGVFTNTPSCISMIYHGPNTIVIENELLVWKCFLVQDRNWKSFASEVCHSNYLRFGLCFAC